MTGIEKYHQFFLAVHPSCRAVSSPQRHLPAGRTYEQPVMLFGRAPHDMLMAIAAQIYGRVPGINRCVLDLSGRRMARAEPRAAGVTRARM